VQGLGIPCADCSADAAYTVAAAVLANSCCRAGRVAGAVAVAVQLPGSDTGRGSLSPALEQGNIQSTATDMKAAEHVHQQVLDNQVVDQASLLRDLAREDFTCRGTPRLSRA
jgi:hypothetical protein